MKNNTDSKSIDNGAIIALFEQIVQGRKSFINLLVSLSTGLLSFISTFYIGKNDIQYVYIIIPLLLFMIAILQGLRYMHISNELLFDNFERKVKGQESRDNDYMKTVSKKLECIHWSILISFFTGILIYGIYHCIIMMSS